MAASLAGDNMKILNDIIQKEASIKEQSTDMTSKKQIARQFI